MTVWTRTEEVKAGGRIELVLPELNAGELVQVSVQLQGKKIRRIGTGKGTVWMSDDFDAPLDDFEDYMK